MKKGNNIWPPFINEEGHKYTLDHVHPFGFNVIQAASGTKTEKKYPCWVSFSCHCFTRKPTADEKALESCSYPIPNHEKRVFCEARYALSFRLRGLIEGQLSDGKTKCFHTEHDNFFLVEATDNEGQSVNYEVYFKPYKSDTHTGTLNIYIVSAYPRTQKSKYTPKQHSKMRIQVIAHNTLNNKPLKKSPRK